MNTHLAADSTTIPSDTSATPMAHHPQSADASNDAVNDGRWGNGLRTIRDAALRVWNSIRSLGPYAAIEILLPGGTIIALALWAYRKRLAARASVKAVSTALVPAVRRAPLRAPCTQ